MIKPLCLSTLEVRRKSGDLIQICKIVNGFEEVAIDLSQDEGRIHRYQIKRERTGKNPSRNGFLPHRNTINNNWNVLPSEVVNADAVDRFLEMKNLF